jgi:hypothetical protein
MIFALVALLCSANAARSQDVTATITGTITDSSGAPLAGATVTAKDMDRGTVWPATTNTEGIYNILRIPVGSYSLKAEAKGFQTALHPPFTLVLNQTARVDIQMKVGAVTETVEVTSEIPLLQSQTAEVSTIIDAKTNESLPLASRNYIQLTLLAPGSVSPNPQQLTQGQRVDGAGRPYINGNREQANNFLLDGIDNNQVSDNLVGYQPTPDSIQEFNLITQNASAEFGKFQGGIVSVMIKSGTNSFHGDIWEFFRNDKLNANSWQNNISGSPRDKLRWNQFGGTVGGPIKKDKLFFFADYQGQRFAHPSSTAAPASVLTAAERGGNFGALCTSGFTGGICNDRDISNNVIHQLYNPFQTDASGNRVPFANNVIPTNLENSAAKALFAAPEYAPPNNGTGLQNNFLYNTQSSLNVDQGDARIDYNLSGKDRLFGRYSREFQNNPATATAGGAIFGLNTGKATIHSGVLNWTRNVTSSIFNDARIGVNYVRVDTNNSDTTSLGNFGQNLGIANSNAPGAGLLALNISGGKAGNVGGNAVVQLFADTVIQADDTVLISRGRHTFHAGFQFWRQRVNTYYSGNNGQLGNLNFTGVFSGAFNTGAGTNPAGTSRVGAGEADLFLGLSSDQGRGVKGGTWGQRQNVFGIFFQDDWRVTSRLTVNWGLRYEDFTPWGEVRGRQVNFGLYSGVPTFPAGAKIPAGFTPPGLAPVNGSNGALYNSYNGIGNLQPRLGFAWTPGFLDGKTVLRGAFTVSSYLEGTGTNLRLTVNPPFATEFQTTFSAASSQSPGTLPPTIDQGLQLAPPSDPLKNAILRVWAPDVRPSEALQWNLTIQHQLAKSLSFQVGYVGQRGTHLMVPSNYNQKILNSDGTTTPGPYLAGNPALKNEILLVSGTASTGNSWYHALQAVLQKQYGNGLQANVAYTYSKCMTNSIGYYGSWGGSQTVPASPYYQNIYNSRAEWGPCFFDVKHDLTAYAVYDIPVGRGRKYGKNMNHVLNAVIGDWNISPIYTIRGGFPLTFEEIDFSHTNSRGERPNCNGSIPVVKRPLSNGIQWFDGSSVSEPADKTFGSCGIGVVRGPGLNDLDLSLQKNFLFGESRKLQFRTDFLNTFNHPILSTGYCTIGFGAAGCGSFGQISGSQLERNIQFALKFYF